MIMTGSEKGLLFFGLIVVIAAIAANAAYQWRQGTEVLRAGSARRLACP